MRPEAEGTVWRGSAFVGIELDGIRDEEQDFQHGLGRGRGPLSRGSGIREDLLVRKGAIPEREAEAMPADGYR